MPRAMVGNAADEEQVQKAGRTEATELEAFYTAVRGCLDTHCARVVLGQLLQECGVIGGMPYDPSARMHYDAGKQAIGRLLIKWLSDAREDGDIDVYLEHRRRQRDQEAKR